jgi:hypothetical protein
MGDFRRRLTTDPSGFTLLPNQTSFTLASFYITCFSLTDFVFLTFLLPFLFSNPLGLHSSSSVNGSWFVSGTIYIYGLNYITEYNHDASVADAPSFHSRCSRRRLFCSIPPSRPSFIDQRSLFFNSLHHSNTAKYHSSHRERNSRMRIGGKQRYAWFGEGLTVQSEGSTKRRGRSGGGEMKPGRSPAHDT